MKIGVFKPQIAKKDSAFEAMSELYRYCYQQYECAIELIVDAGDTFTSPHYPVRRITSDKYSALLGTLLSGKKKYYFGILPSLRSYDIIVTGDPYVYYNSFIVAYIASKLYESRLLVDVSLTFIPEGQKTGWKTKILHWIVRKCASDIDTYLVPTPASITRLDKLGYLPNGESQVEVLGHPVDTATFHPATYPDSSGTLTLLSVGRLVPEKGHPELIQAIAPILQNRDNVFLKIVGSGELEAQLRDLIIELGLQERVVLTGKVPHVDIPQIYRTADIYVALPHSAPYWEEFFGVAYVEAMSSALPIVTTSCGGIPHVVKHGQTGYVVNEGDIEAFRRYLRGLLRSKQRRHTLGQNGREWVKGRYSVDVLGERYYNILTKGLGCSS